MAGWDHPLKHYFLTILDLDVDEDESEIAWSTLAHPSELDIDSTNRLETQLETMGIEAPDGFWERVHRQERNVVHLFADGGWRRVQ